MTTKEVLIEEIEKAPEPILREVFHYMEYLKEKVEVDEFNGLLLSKSALAKDWSTPEEDEAWKNL
ncbi:MAG: DUF2281 domain-containing protein [Verrucomicrobia bacterium]|nr:DUF2281 domain-containing protein [Verrucomicrobiota bacterium]MBU4429286.1 DUF2281 domain-containing protein [Verrucomicrobiota bacterium]MBU4497587.1 DUF2281 domain-containing protein [Verrucomicrobiota bacterium]MCG2680745.1 DUF2281 domain-containing protein [Kiritimatiellia bacterium]